MIRKSKSFVIIAISCLTFCGFLFYSCEKDSSLSENHDNNEFLSIEGKVDNPETILDLTKLRTLREANSRVFRDVELEKGLLKLTASSGAELNMSEDLFQYGVKNVESVNNLIIKGKVISFIDDNGKLCLRSAKISSLNGIERLKSSLIEESEPYNPTNNTANQNLAWLNNLFNSDPDGYLSEYMDVKNTKWNGDSMGIYSVSGYGTLNGQTAGYMILNNCGGWVDPVNCEANYIAYTTRQTWPQGSITEQRIIRTSNGDPIATITIYR